MKNIKGYMWTIPALIAVVCGILNPCGGLVIIVAVVLSFAITIVMQHMVTKDAIYLNKKYQTSEDVAIDLSVASWVMVPFSFTIAGLIMNFLVFYHSYTTLMSTNVLPKIGFTLQLFHQNTWAISCIMFVLTALFSIISMVMIVLEGIKLKNGFKMNA